MRLVLENRDGKTIRTFNVEGEKAVVISRLDTRRVEVHTNLYKLEREKIKFNKIAEISRGSVEKAPLTIGRTGRLRVVSAPVVEILRNPNVAKEDDRSWYTGLALVGLAAIVLFCTVLTRELNGKVAEETKQEIVHIVLQKPETPKPVVRNRVAKLTPVPKKIVQQTHKVVTHTPKTVSIKRVGALSVFGSMNKSSQHGGVNLGAVNSSRGPGLGGLQGSGGVQTTLYGKGLVAAPLGSGGNIHGAGGYGTKGKGGGQAGYGKMTLVGSAGAAALPLGREALVEGGLDRDMIAEIINRNMGQIRYCYEQGLQGEPKLAGRVAVRFTIGGNGIVTTAGVDHSTLNSQMVENCMLAHLRTWKFPLPERGLAVHVAYPFSLYRAGQG